MYSVSQKMYPLRFSEIFSQRMRILKQNFTCLLYVNIYGKLQNFIRLSLNVTKLCYIKCHHPANVHCSMMAKYTDFIAKDAWPQNSPDINPLDCHMWGAMLRLPQTSIKAQDYSGAEKCTAADLGKCWEGGGLGSIHSVPSSFFSCPLLIPSRLADLCFLLEISASNYNEIKLSLISCCCLLLLRQSSSTGINVITHHSLRGSAAVC